MSQSAVQHPTPNLQQRWLMVAILLIAAAFRFLALDSAPPGWRDDELIEFNMDRRIADGWRPLFITEAEGHEPVYHYLHAGTLLLFGDNIVGYKWLPMAFGLLTIALTYALARKMFDANARVALLAAALMAVSFWPIMYARFGVRHIGTLPWMLVAMYLLYATSSRPSLRPSPLQGEGVGRPRPLKARVKGGGRLLVAGICLAAGLMTYFAGRAVPIVLIGFLVYLLIFHRPILKRVWWRYALAIFIAVAIAAPMFIEISRTPGADKRTEVVGGPLIELRNGNVQPAIETTLGTLGMFTFAGDPESLYNVPGRPVFDWITGAFFYLGVMVCLIRLKRVESGFTLAWLLIGIAPAFVSVPAASFSHTIVALPVVYIVGAIGIVTVCDKMTKGQDDTMIVRHRVTLSSLHLVIVSVLLVLNGWLTLRDYFGTWASDWIVQFQYHAPTRAMAKWLDQNPQVADVAIGTHASQLLLDPLALQIDLRRDLSASWFNAETALINARSNIAIVTAMQSPGAEVQKLLAGNGQLLHKQPAFEVYTLLLGPRMPPLGGAFDQGRLILRSLNGPIAQMKPGDTLAWRTYWLINQPVNRSRLKLFLHVLNAKNEVVAGDDREDVNWTTVQPGEGVWQISQLTLPADLSAGQYPVEVGWYIPETGERLKRDDGTDRLLLDPIEVVAP